MLKNDPKTLSLSLFLLIGHSYSIEGQTTEPVWNPSSAHPVKFIPRASTPAWSFDGTKIAFTGVTESGDRDIYVINSDGSNQVNITNSPGEDAYPAWSPDGTKIAFTSLRDGNQNILVVSADGTHPLNLTQDRQQEFSPSWSPDGSQLAFTLDTPRNKN